MDYNFYLNEIVSFNNDKNLVALREKYNEPSFFEIISKERSETTYSAFLKWLFLINSTGSNGVSPIMSFLDILVKRCNQQDETLIKPKLQEAILSRKLIIKNVSVETEQFVNQLAAQALKSPQKDDSRTAFLKNLKDYCQDRIDIFIKCEVLIGGKVKQLQIFIENKIDSIEGGAKNTTSSIRIKKTDNEKLSEDFKKYITVLSQTRRYYEATHQGNENIIQLYVFLTPLSSGRLDDFNALKEEQKKYDSETQKRKKQVLRDDEHFIQINYQDILDGIVEPLLSSSISGRNRFFLEEFKNELAFPNIDSFDEQSCIAIGKEVSETMTKYWEKYKPLIIDSIIAATNSKYYSVNGTYYNGQPRQEIIKALIDNGEDEVLKNKEWVSDSVGEGDKDKYSNIDGTYKFKKGINFNSLLQTAKDNGLDIEEVGPQNLNLDTKTKDVLISFLTENSSFIFAIMNGLEEEERKKVQCFMPFLTKRNSTRYSIFYKDRVIGTDLTFTDAAFRIIKCWAEDVKGKNVSLKDLQETFPRDISIYYERGKWFRHLIYEYNEKGEYLFDDGGLDGVKDESNWNFYTNNKTKDKHCFEVKDGVKVVVLKMWHEYDVENLIEYVTEKELFGKDNLTIKRS